MRYIVGSREIMYQVLLFILIIIPALHVIASPRSRGGAKVGWFILMVLFSWLAYPFFLIVTQKELDKNRAGSS